MPAQGTSPGAGATHLSADKHSREAQGNSHSLFIWVSNVGVSEPSCNCFPPAHNLQKIFGQQGEVKINCSQRTMLLLECLLEKWKSPEVTDPNTMSKDLSDNEISLLFCHQSAHPPLPAVPICPEKTVSLAHEFTPFETKRDIYTSKLLF